MTAVQMRDVMGQHLQSFQLPPLAIKWLLDLWDAIQAFDDVVDGDPVPREAMERVIYSTLVGMPSNPFFQANAQLLLPVMSLAILKWKASDSAERSGKADPRSFVWRASYYDVVMAVVSVCHGPDVAMGAAQSVMSLYGESLDDYLKEFGNA